jgi:drug/metabolite transporter (DMT)-like permease
MMQEKRPLPPGLVLAIAVLAMSWAGPLVRLSSAPALVISAWRLILSVIIIRFIMRVRRHGNASVRLSIADWRLAVLAGLLLAAHFWSWLASLELTSVASSVVLVDSQPLFVAILSILFLHERPHASQWFGIALGIAGAAMIGWGDFGRGRSPLVGDLLALAGAVFISGYYVIGRNLRQRLDLWSYTAVVYGVAAAALALALALSPTAHFAPYPARDWLIFLALALGPMLLGHSGINYALRYVPAYIANLAILGEPVGSTLIAWLLPAIREKPPLQTLFGGALILIGIAIGVLGQRNATGSGTENDRQGDSNTHAKSAASYVQE